jgi:hypothetical protein
LHMHALVARHGQPGWVAALTPFSVDGMIVAASTTLLGDSRTGRRGGVLPWALLAVGSVASLAANVAVAEPTLIGRVIAAWPSFALTASYELLTRQVRRSSAPAGISGRRPQQLRAPAAGPAKPVPASAADIRGRTAAGPPARAGSGQPGTRNRSAACLAMGTGPPCQRWQPAQRQTNRQQLWTSRAVGPSRQMRGHGREFSANGPSGAHQADGSGTVRRHDMTARQ